MKALLPFFSIVFLYNCKPLQKKTSEYNVEIHGVTTLDMAGVPTLEHHIIRSTTDEDAYLQGLRRYYNALTTARIGKGDSIIFFEVCDSLGNNIKNKFSKKTTDSLIKVSLENN